MKPILRQASIDYYGHRATLTAYGGLCYMRGNVLPYFILIGDVQIPQRRDVEECGMLHDRLLSQWPDLADLAALRLSDINGQPMHAKANGWYWLVGFYSATHGNMGEQYHGANSSEKTPDECLQIFADHVRITLDAARSLAFRLYTDGGGNPQNIKREFCDWCDAQGNRWKAEADAAINKYGLVVFGDEYHPQQPEAKE